MNNLPLISVIVPVYNAEKTIEACINSILSQDYKNIEIVLIDDGSKDSSLSLCEKYSNTNDNVHVFHYENAGAAEARNRGIDNANGDLIAFIDSDDLILPNYISYLYELMQEFSSDIAVCSYIKLYANKLKGYYSAGKFNSSLFETNNKDNYRVSFNRVEAVKRLLYQRNFISAPWGMLSKKSLFTNVRFPKGKRAEDMATIYRLFAEAKSVAYGDNKLYLYIQRKTNTVFSTSNLLNPDYYSHCINMVDFIRASMPEAIPAAKSRLFSACFQILSETPATDANKVLVGDIYQTIEDIRKDILKDSHGKLRNRAAAFISCISIPLLHKVLRIYYVINKSRL